VSVRTLELPVLLTPKEVAEQLRTTVAVLAQWRFHKRVALPYVRTGRSVKYRAEDVAEFVRQNLVPR
jgi:hypothetical protein